MNHWKKPEPKNLLLDIANLTQDELDWLKGRICWNQVGVLSAYRDRDLGPVEIGLLPRKAVKAELDRFWLVGPPSDVEVSVNAKLGFRK